jgi:2-keto-3-deoxy-L-rhamnonate aldolase RhmA
METANRRVAVLPGDRDRRRPANVDAIAATPGVDAIIIGPGDLSDLDGHAGNRQHPEVDAAVAHLIERSRAHGNVGRSAAYDAEHGAWASPRRAHHGMSPRRRCSRAPAANSSGTRCRADSHSPTP